MLNPSGTVKYPFQWGVGTVVLEQFDGVDAATARQTELSNAPPPLAFLSIAQILAHPRWPLARDCYIGMALDTSGPDPAIKRLMQNVARIVLFNIIVGLHEARGPSRKTWPTINRIRETFEPFGLASPRRFDEMIARMRTVGLIELQPAPSDRRIRLVVPTERMIAEDYAWQDFNMRALAVLQPESRAYDEVFSHNPLYRQAQRIVSAGIFHKAQDILDPDANPLVPFLARQDGTKIILSYLEAALACGDPSRVSLSYETVSSRISTSRTHIRNLIELLEADGYLKRHGKGGNDIELMPELWRQAELFIASILSGNDYWWQLTLARVASLEQSTQ